MYKLITGIPPYIYIWDRISAPFPMDLRLFFPKMFLKIPNRKEQKKI